MFLVGSRIINQKNLFIKNYYGVRIMSMLINFLFKTISDGGLPKYSKNIYDKFKYSTNGFDFEFEVSEFAKNGFKVSEFPEYHLDHLKKEKNLELLRMDFIS